MKLTMATKGLQHPLLTRRAEAGRCHHAPAPATGLTRRRRQVMASAQQVGERKDGAMHSTRRDAMLMGVGCVGTMAACSPLPVDAKTNWTSAGGIEYYDVPVGKGDTTFDGDTIKITFTAHTYDVDTGKKIRTFDPFVNGGGGSSMAKGFKLTLGGSNGDIIPGLNLAIVGGDGVDPMRQGGKRIVRIPPELAFGAKGHHCYLGLLDQCEVPPNTPVEIEVTFMDFV